MKGFNTTYIIKLNDTQILNSYKIKKIKDMKSIIKYIRKKYPSYVLVHNQRSLFSLINEWRAHNLLFKLNIAPNRTKDVDFTLTDSFLMKLGYFFLSILYF